MRYYIALGENLCKYIVEKQYEKASDIIKDNDGDIICYNPTEDCFESLIECISGWCDLMVLSSEELDEIAKFVELDRPIFKVGEEEIPIEKMTEFLKESSIRQLVSKQILST